MYGAESGEVELRIGRSRRRRRTEKESTMWTGAEPKTFLLRRQDQRTGPQLTVITHVFPSLGAQIVAASKERLSSMVRQNFMSLSAVQIPKTIFDFKDSIGVSGPRLRLASPGSHRSSSIAQRPQIALSCSDKHDLRFPLI